jgi:DNA-binding MarR family transcriptional regulator
METLFQARADYRLEDQVGFVLRQVGQRHGEIFVARFGADITAMQWAALAKLGEIGPTSQNQLGRLTAMDVATIKGVVDRLTRRGLTESAPDPDDARRRLVRLTQAGEAFLAAKTPIARAITEATLAPLTEPERATLHRLLVKLK